MRLSFKPSPSQTASWAIFRPPSRSRRKADAKKNRIESVSGPDRSRLCKEDLTGDWANASQTHWPTYVLYVRPAEDSNRRPFTVAYCWLMLGGTGNVTLIVSDVTTGRCDGVRSAVSGFDGSDVGDRVVLLIGSNFLGMDGCVGLPRGYIGGRRNFDERKLCRGRSDGMEPS